MTLKLTMIKRTEPRLLREMADHYSQPKGFVGRNICYAVEFDNIRYGSIVGGSATLHLKPRDTYIGAKPNLCSVVNNIFYHIEKQDGGYPVRNFASYVLDTFCDTIATDWKTKYGDSVEWFESLVELPRTGECYKRAGWVEVGQTVGYTCKRTAGKGTDSWSGKRVWDTEHLRPKRIFVKKAV